MLQSCEQRRCLCSVYVHLAAQILHPVMSPLLPSFKTVVAIAECLNAGVLQTSSSLRLVASALYRLEECLI